MFISESFKNDMLSKNTKIVPVVIIEKLLFGSVYKYTGFSTSNIEIVSNQVDGAGNEQQKLMYFKPLLMGLPKLKESIDVTNGRYKISSVTLNLSNIEYNGSRVSDLFTNNLLINENVSIHLKSQSCTTITPDAENVSEDSKTKDCAIVYVGKIRSVSHTNEKATIKLEDLTEQKIHKELPSEMLSDSGDILEKFKNKPIPMAFGNVPNALMVGRVVGGKPTFSADYKEIFGINEYDFIAPNEFDTDATYTYGAIKTYEDGYVPLLRNIQWKFVTDTADEDNYADVVVGQSQYVINDDNTISIQDSGLWNVDRFQGIEQGKPKDIRLYDMNVQAASEGNFWDTYETVNAIDLINSDDYDNMTDGNVNTSVNKQATDAGWTIVYTPDSYDNYNIMYSAVSNPYSLMWNFASKGAKFSKLLTTTINGNKLPVRGDVDWAYQGRWHENQSGVLLMPTPLAVHFVNEQNISYQWAVTHHTFFYQFLSTSDFASSEFLGMWGTYQGLVDTFAMSAKHGLDQATQPSDFVIDSLINAGYSYDWNNNAPIKFKVEHNSELFQEFNGSTDHPVNTEWVDGMPVLRFYEPQENYYGIQFLAFSIWKHDFDGWVDVNNFYLDLNINEIDNFAVVEYDDASKMLYYSDVKGRVDDEILNFTHQLENPNTDYLENPIDIMRHILTEELGITKFNEEEYEEAWMQHYGWQFAFSVNKRINSKKLIEEISASTMSFPRLKNNGEFGFVNLKQDYFAEDYDNAVEIDINDIIKYNFKLTDPNKIMTKLDFHYGYDGGGDSYLKTITADEFVSYSGYLSPAKSSNTLLRFNGIENVEDNKVILENKHIQSISTAEKFIVRKFYNEKVQHLIIDLSLPLQYSEVEVGTLIKFPKDKLIDGMKAYGMDYTNPILHGTVTRYPLFLVTNVQRGLDSLSITCYHLHAQYSQQVQVDFPDGTFDLLPNIPSDWSLDRFPNGNWVDPAEIVEGDHENIGYAIEDYTEMPEFSFVIGNNSAFQAGGTSYQTAYSRTFRITDPTIEEDTEDLFNIFNLDTRFETLFGLQTFGLNDWADLIPPLDDDGYGHGNITTGGGTSNVGQYKALEIRMRSRDNVNRRILALRNIAGTAFDPDVEDNIIPNNLFTASTSTLKLGWVLYKANEDWIQVQCLNRGQHISNNLNMTMHPWFEPTNDPAINHLVYEYTMTLYPTLIPLPELKLYYQIGWEGSLQNSPAFSGGFDIGDTNLDSVIDIVDLVTLSNLIMDKEYQSSSDISQDQMLDIDDVIQLVDTMQEDTSAY